MTRIMSAKAWLLIGLWLLVIPTASASPGTIAVLYPESQNPLYEKIFEEIIDGIKEQSSEKVIPFAITSNFDPEELKSWAKAIKVNAVIAMGRSGQRAAEVLNGTLPIICGATFLAPDPDTPHIAGISMTVDPDAVFKRLVTLVPGVKRVHVVYNPDENDWLIKLAKQSAKKHGLELIAYEASNLRTAARLYRKIIDQTNSKNDAIWLPQDNITTNSKAVLPMLLRESWDRSLIVVSSNPLHAKKGTLFSIYPSNQGMGKSLAEMTIKYLNNSTASAQILPLRDIEYAVNIRTADHLDIDINDAAFDLIFPAPRTAQ